MPYYMRFIIADDNPISLVDLEQALRESDSEYSITDIKEQTGAFPGEQGDLKYGNECYAVIEINKPLNKEEIMEFIDEVEVAEVPKKAIGNKQIVLEVLKKAKALARVQVLGSEKGTEAVLEKLDPVWEWLFENREGLLHADGEGYYDSSGLLLEVL